MNDFNDWMNEVDRCIGDRIGLSSMDLPDCCYRDWFEDGLEAEEAADMALEDMYDD